MLGNIKGNYAAWLYAFAIAVVFLFIRGYSFNVGDQSEHLPQVYQALDPELYTNDYFVPASQAQFTVRHFYEKLVVVIAQTIGIEWGVFLFTLLSITVSAFAFYQIAWVFFKQRWAAWLSPVFVLFVFYGFTVGGNCITYNMLISSTLAKALASLTLLQVLYRRWIFAGVLLGAASLFQVLVGLQLIVVLTLVIPVIALEKRWLSLLGCWLGYLALAMFILVPIFGQQFGASVPYDAELYYEILYRFRNYHHYLPSLFPVNHYIKFFGILILGGIGYWVVRPAKGRFYHSFIVVAILGMLVYTVGVEMLHLSFLGKIQWFKITIWIVAFSAIMVAGLASLVMQSLLPSERIASKMPLVSAAIALVLLVIMVNSAWLPARFDGRYMIGNRRLTHLERMHQWISTNTDKTAIVLVSPENSSFSCQAQRSMPVHFHAIIHEPEFMLPWYDKVKQIYGVGLDDIAETNARDLATQLFETRNYYGSTYEINYRLDNANTCQFQNELGAIVHQEGPWIFSRFKSD